MKSYSKLLVGGVVGLLLLLVLTTGTVVAADSSKPGDFLYTFDLLGEYIQRATTFGDVNKTDLEMKLLDEREEELEALSGAEDQDVSDAIERLANQETEVQERIRVMNENSDIDQGEKERITERSEEQVQEHEQTLEQVQEQLRDKEMDQQADQVENVQEQYQQRSDNYRNGNGGDK